MTLARPRPSACRAARARAMSTFSADDSEAWIRSTPPRAPSDPRASSGARLIVLPQSPRGRGGGLSRCLPSLAIGALQYTTFSLADQHLGDPQALESIAYIARRALVEPGSSWRAGSLGLVLIGVALRGGAPPGAEAVRPWQDQAHNKTLCSASSQGLARCAPAHPPHPAAQGAGRTNGKINASRAEPPRPAAAVTRASAAPLTRPAVVPSKPAAAAALPKPAVALPARPAAALPRTPKAGARTRPPKQ